MTRESVENQVHAALKSAADVRDAVHGITLKALSEGALDAAAIKQVLSSAMSGVAKGAADMGSNGAQAVGEALKGLDEAVAGAAKATQLAVQEAAGRVGEFSRTELQQRLEEMKALETTLFDTIRHGAGEAGGVVAETARQFAEHARLQGSAVGHQMAETLPKLSAAVAGMAQAQFASGVHTLRSGSAMLAGMAAGMLSGLADRLQPAGRPPESAAPDASTADAKPHQTP